MCTCGLPQTVMLETWPAWAMAVLPVLVLVVLVLVWHRILVRLRGPEPMPYSRVSTADGALLALYRTGNPAGAPVILVGGLAVSHMYWDFAAPRLSGRDQSVSDYLGQQGFDVWSFDYRGHGRSRAPSLWSSYTVQHLVDEDLHAVIQSVLQLRPGLSAQHVHLVAHSFGAVAALAYLAQSGTSYGRSALLAPPLAMAESTRLARWIVRNRAIISTWPVVAFGSFARWFPYAFAALQPPLARYFITAQQTSAATFLRWTMTCLADVSSRLTIEIMGWIAHHGARWQRRAVREVVPDVRTPLLYLTSADDRLAPSNLFESVAEQLPAHSKWLVLPEDASMGNCDMLIGRTALSTVWDPLVAWLRQSAPSK